MKKFLGYVVVNVKSKKFVDYDGTEGDSFESWDNKTGPQEVLDEVDYYVARHNNKHSRKIAQARNHLKIGKLFVEA